MNPKTPRNVVHSLLTPHDLTFTPEIWSDWVQNTEHNVFLLIIVTSPFKHNHGLYLENSKAGGGGESKTPAPVNQHALALELKNKLRRPWCHEIQSTSKH